MKRFFENWHLPENFEIVIMMVLGIMLQMADGSPYSLKERWMLVWDTELPAENFSAFVQKCIKTLLSVIVVVRCVTTYAYVVSAMLVIFCLLRNTAPKLMLLWLLIAGVKSVCMTFLEALAGVYVCSAFGKIRKACIEFFISKALEIIFASYLWGNVLNSYQDMERKAENNRTLQKKDQVFIQKMDCGPQRARSLVDESTLYKTACLNNFEFRDVPQIILQMLRAGPEMSQDSLLDPGMMLASVSNMGSFDSLKTSQSLGELGFMDLRNTQIFGMEEDENLSHQEKALRFLKLTNSEIDRIKLNRSSLESDIYTIDRDIWKGVETTQAYINKPKQARTQVFIRDIPQLEPCEENNARTKIWKKSFDFNFGFSFSNLFNEKQSEEDEEEESFLMNQDVEEEEEDSTQMFMSNLKEGVVIYPNRLGIVFRKMKGSAYAELYRQDFMSLIGPEVFDKACKLPKVTSLTKLGKISAAETVENSLDKGKKISPNELTAIRRTSVEDLPIDQSPVQEPAGVVESFREKLKGSREANPIEEKSPDCPPHLIYELQGPNKSINGSRENLIPQDNCSEHFTAKNNDLFPSFKSSADTDVCEETKPFFRKRRIIIRRIGEEREKNFFRNFATDTLDSSKNSDPCFAFRFKTMTKTDKQDADKASEKLSSNSKTSNSDTNWLINYDGYNKQVYFITELLQKPLSDVLLTYYDLKNKLHVTKKCNVASKRQRKDFFYSPLQNYHLRQYEKILQSLTNNPIPEKVWKSKVLKTVEARSKETSPVTLKSVLNIIKKESILRKLFRYEYAHFISKNKNFKNSFNEIFFSKGSAIGPKRLNFKTRNLRADEMYTSDHSVSSKPEKKFDFSSHPSRGDEARSSKESKNEEFYSDRESLKEVDPDGFTSKNLTTIKSYSSEIQNEKAEVEKFVTELKSNLETELQNIGKTDSKVLENEPDGESISSQESDEPISLYYSKAANLASPLFDMKRFIYPDHIHYSYKHVKKKGFDVDINGGFPLLMRESLTMGSPVKIGNKLISKTPEFEITRRPMDLSFASTNAFAEWQSNDQNDADLVISEKHVQKYPNKSTCKRDQSSSFAYVNKNKKSKKTKRSKISSDRNDSRSSFKKDSKSKVKSCEGNFNNIKYLYSTKDYVLIEKLLRMHMQFNNNNFENMRKERKPVQISSAQLHSNKGRINSTYNPAIFLQENKTRSERKKIESQEERTKDMFARLEREALLQNKNVQKSFGPNRNS